MKNINILELAKRIYNNSFMGFSERGESVESIAKRIEQDPLSVLGYMVDQIEELTSEF